MRTEVRAPKLPPADGAQRNNLEERILLLIDPGIDYGVGMNEPQLIWRFGRWIGARGMGTARLGWTGGTLVLGVRGGRAVSVEGPDPSIISEVLGCGPIGHTDLLLEAREAAERTGAEETRALAIVKSIVENGIRSWILDEHRTLEIVEGDVPAGDGPNISLPHAIVEMILSDESEALPRAVLEDHRLLLRRSPGFLESYASLQLNQEADLVAAKITGHRTAEEIIERAPQDSVEVVRLLAALIVAGFIEPVPVAAVEQENAPADPVVMPPVANATHRLPPALIIGGVIFLAILLAAAGWLLLHHAHGRPAAKAHFGVVIDHGCQPQDLQRMLRKSGKHPKILTIQPGHGQSPEPCWDLVWGNFPSKQAVKEAVPHIPQAWIRKGVTKQIVALTKASMPSKVRGN